MFNKNFLSKLTIEIPQLPGIVRMAKAVSSTVELVNLETLGSVN
jgi:hypothetical protein